MKRHDAEQVLIEFFALQDVESPGLNDAGLGGVLLGTVPVTFEHQADTGHLRCHALIHRFVAPARPDVLRAFEVVAGTLDTGGGSVEYLVESGAMCLVRTYAEPPSAEDLTTDLFTLALASSNWSEQGVEAVARVLHS